MSRAFFLACVAASIGMAYVVASFLLTLVETR